MVYSWFSFLKMRFDETRPDRLPACAGDADVRGLVLTALKGVAGRDTLPGGRCGEGFAQNGEGGHPPALPAVPGGIGRFRWRTTVRSAHRRATGRAFFVRLRFGPRSAWRKINLSPPSIPRPRRQGTVPSGKARPLPWCERHGAQTSAGHRRRVQSDSSAPDHDTSIGDAVIQPLHRHGQALQKRSRHHRPVYN